MKCLTDTEFVARVSDWGLNFEEGDYAGFELGAGVRGSRTPRIVSAGLQMTVPLSSARRSLLVETLFANCASAKQWLIWMQEYELWGSEDYTSLWYAIREGHGESRSIREAPGHLFSESEHALARGMARLALLCGWDSYWLSEPAAVVIYMSHDDYMEIYAPDEKRLASIADRLALLEFKVWGRSL